MTQVQPTATTLGGVGLFAMREFNVGDVILKEESPLLVLSPPKENDASLLLKQQTTSPSDNQSRRKQATRLCESIVPPPSIPIHQADNFRGMIQAAVSFSQQQQHCDKETLFQLYRPVGESAQEQEIVQVSNEALDYLQTNALGDLKTLLTTHSEDVRNIMLIWSCNSFQGGRIYEKHSRINHSCNPNAIVQSLPSEKDGQLIRAVAPIAVGDEITISYLGLFLYADGPTRREQLAKHKHFVCTCERCHTTPDVAAAIPCPLCHKQSGRYLEEDVQYDDEGTVHYAIPPSASSNSAQCAHCHETTVNDKTPNHPLQLARTVSSKVTSHLEEKQGDSDDDDGNAEIEEEWEEQLLQLASSVLGARHWTTNLLLLVRLNCTLETLSSIMIATGRPPDLEQVAELMDSLERLVRFVEGLSLKLHMGHLLGNVVIGVARMLVTLGDVKSKKYASEWLQKIQNDYVTQFESVDMKKVVDALAVAWEKGDGGTADNDPSDKRAKIS